MTARELYDWCATVEAWPDATDADWAARDREADRFRRRSPANLTLRVVAAQELAERGFQTPTDYGVARELAESLVAVAGAAGLPTRALITDMNQVLGTTAGNALEMREAIDFLAGRGTREPRLEAVTLALAVLEVAVLAFIGRVVDMMKEATSPQTFFRDHALVLALMAGLTLIVRPLLSLATARARQQTFDWAAIDIPRPEFLGTRVFDSVPLEEITPFIDWGPFFSAWELHGRFPDILEDAVVGAEAKRLFADAQKLLARIVAEKRFTARAVAGFWPANSVDDSIEVYADDVLAAAGREADDELDGLLLRGKAAGKDERQG